MALTAVTLQAPAGHLANLARRFEDLGVDSVWTGDYFQSGPVRAAVLGAATERVQVGTHVLQAFARSPLATALAAQELQELTGGRFVLGLGSQLPTANRRWHGVETGAPVPALCEYVHGVRALLDTDGPVTFTGARIAYQVPAFRGTPRPPTAPIWIGGAGPAMVRLAGRVADGMAGHLLWSYDHIRDHVRPVLGDLPLSVPRFVAPATVPGWRSDLVRRLAHYLVTPAYQPMLAAQGIVLDRGALLAAVRDDQTDELLRIVGPHLAGWSISDPEELRQHRAAAAELGMTLMLLVPAGARDAARTIAYETELAELLSGRLS